MLCLTKTCFIRKLSKKDYLKLKMLCLFSNNLYNVALYHVRQHYFIERQYLKYESNYHVTKDNENYKLLHAHAAQQTMKIVDRSFKSFFGLLEKARKGGYLYGKDPILIKVSEEIESLNLKEVRILPVNKGRAFKIQYVYEQEEEDQGWNKRRVKLQAILMKQGRYTSEQIQRMTIRRNNRANDYLKKTARYIINYCIKNNIGTVVCGYNGDNPYKGEFSGKRIKRGLYRSSNGRIVNADVNGAANILRKSKQNFNFEGLCRGVLATPSRIRQA